MASASQRSDLSPISPENLLNPVPYYKRLREEAPVHWSQEVHAWLITRYEDVTAGFRDPRLSANRLDFFTNQLSALGPTVLVDFIENSKRQLLMKDGPDHIRMRRRLGAGFTPQALDAWRPVIRDTIESLVDGVVAQGEFDFVKEISFHFPTRVIVKMFGVPLEDEVRFQKWAEPLADFSNPTPNADMLSLARQANAASAGLSNYLMALIDKRRQAPGQDMLSQMIHHQDAGTMTQEELAANASLLITAGHLTTTDQLSSGIHDLLNNPEQLEMMRRDMTLVRSAVEEMIRFSPAAPFMHRIVAQDFQLHGQSLRKGDVVLLGMAAANRDPSVFPDPDRFDITRNSAHQKHMSFGFGPHACMGAGVARRELEIAIEVLLNRIPNLRLDPEKQPQPKINLVFRGYNSLPVRW